MPGAVNRVLSLQLTALWQNHGNAAIALGAAGACYGLWRALLGASSVFVDVGDGAATGGMLALAASSVAFGYLYLRRRYTIDPQVGGRWGSAGTAASHASAAAHIRQSMHTSMQQPSPGGWMPWCHPLPSSRCWGGTVQPMWSSCQHGLLTTAPPPPLPPSRCFAGCVPAGHVPPQHTSGPAGGEPLVPLL